MYFTELTASSSIKPINCLSHILIYKSRCGYRIFPCSTSELAISPATRSPA